MIEVAIILSETMNFEREWSFLLKWLEVSAKRRSFFIAIWKHSYCLCCAFKNFFPSHYQLKLIVQAISGSGFSPHWYSFSVWVGVSLTDSSFILHFVSLCKTGSLDFIASASSTIDNSLGTSAQDKRRLSETQETVLSLWILINFSLTRTSTNSFARRYAPDLEYPFSCNFLDIDTLRCPFLTSLT